MSKSNQVLVPSFLSSTSASRSIFKSNRNSQERFEIIKKLNGGRNKIFLIQFPQDSKHYILKVYPHESDSKLCNRYLNESRFGTLNHPNIIKFYECKPYFEFESKDTPITSSSCIIMDYEPTGDLGTVILAQKKLLPEPLIRAWFHQLVDALEYMHSNGNYHLDIKPPNILLSDVATLKLADFDISAKKSDNIKTYSRGTKNFRSPEIIDASGRNPAAIDIYSLGITLFVLKTGGYTPYTEDHINQEGNLFHMMFSGSEEFWKLHRYNLQVGKDFFDHDFKELFMNMTQYDPESRLAIQGLKRMKWYNGPVYTKEQIVEYFKNN